MSVEKALVPPPPPPPLPVKQSTKWHAHFANLLADSQELVVHFSYSATDWSSESSDPRGRHGELSVTKGEVLTIVERTGLHWWLAENAEGQRGFVPTNHVKLMHEFVVDEQTLADRMEMERCGDTSEDYGDGAEDEDYFAGYAGLKIHHEMLADEARTSCYHRVITGELRAAIKDRVVLDVGCGTGVLSMFCAMAGASHVYGIEASEMAVTARKLVADNGLSGKVSILKGKCEEVWLPVETVDVIVSEWMGAMLVCESMLFSVMRMRDRYLRSDRSIPHSKLTFELPPPPTEVAAELVTDSDIEVPELSDLHMSEEEQKCSEKHIPGLMLPGRCSLWFTPVDLSEKYVHKYVDFFDDIHGLSFARLKNEAKQEFFGVASFIHAELTDEEQLCERGRMVLEWDMHTVKEDWFTLQSFDVSFTMDKAGKFTGFAGWFQTHFESPLCSESVTLDTSPRHPRTHWAQTLFLFKDAWPVQKGDSLRCQATLFRNTVHSRNFRLLFEGSINGHHFKHYCPVWR